MAQSSKIIIIVLSIVLVIGGFLYYQQQDRTDEASEAEVRETAVDDNSADENFPLLNYIGNHPDAEMTELVAVDDSDSSGLAYRLFEDGQLKHVVVATMPDPEPGSVYEGWLVQPDPLDFFSTGVMEKDDQGRWILEFTLDDGPRSHFRVVITEETIVDEIPERHVIQGDF